MTIPDFPPHSRHFTLLTYNVHSCRGTDRHHDPKRIADVIASLSPDIIALQELDVGRKRTGGVDQAETIAAHLQMRSHFHPALSVSEEHYGDAILTAWPARRVKAGPLPSIGEPRGALWVTVTIGGEEIHVVNTHLGLRRRERIRQAEALLGPDWLGSADLVGKPLVFAGDLNAVPSSSVFARFSKRYPPPSKVAQRLAPTFPSLWPLLRLDHVFGNDRLELLDLRVVKTPLAKKASDHLPLLATLRFRGEASA
ncbi:endonuclease/exonuclease/phosphatase family protein [Ensifer soli]|uniref:endonuclease/exonuclease/phosphatase family protein n=1 Tax=Ciceribacter sp. sgz301302 TaxID=3342379 RepID=UPI0035B721CE